MLQRFHDWLPHIIQVLGVCIFTIGLAALTGYLFDVPAMYTWSPTPMAINTAVCFVLEGIVLFLLTVYIDNKLQQANVSISTQPIVIPESSLFKPPDIIAMLMAVGCFILMAFGKTDVVGILVTICSFYFGQAAVKLMQPDKDKQSTTTK